MRSSLSCDACRKAKVKCTHPGTPPCQRCAKSKISGCVLTRPQLPPPRKRKSRPASGASAATSRGLDRGLASTSTPGSEQMALHPQLRSGMGTDAGTPLLDAAAAAVSAHGESVTAMVGRHIAGLPNTVILKTLSAFTNKFPELAILHVPTFMAELESQALSKESMALLGAVLAVTRGQLTVLGAAWADILLSREEYAVYTRDMLSQFILQPPKLQVVQILLVITLYEWGTRNFHKAWVYCGIAIRIMQALHSLRVAPYPLEPSLDSNQRDPVAVAIETRTYWGCFIMDCMVNSGTYNPPMLPMSEMRKLKIARPLSSVEFAFGPDGASSSSVPVSVPGGMPPADGTLDITQSFEILVGGFDIWVKVMEFIFNDGRKAPGMCAPQNCPWVPGSPWSVSWNRLRAWRAGQHQKLYYPSTSVAVHMTLGYGETFTYLNLLYYVSNLMLHREYTPFLPTRESVPVGPVDPPRLEAPAPAGWWENSSAELFDAGEKIAMLLHEASECGVHLMTPFAGFCAFSAGYVLGYVYRFPKMNLGRSPRAEEYMNMCLNYLEEFRHVWPIADGWIKTIQHASLLYGRAATTARYRGRTRADFGNIHQSVHEFRVVDRSEQHNMEINGADRATSGVGAGSGPGLGAATPGSSADPAGLEQFDDYSIDTNTLLNQLLAEVSSNVDEQGPWSQWWPPMEEVELPMPPDQNMPMLL